MIQKLFFFLIFLLSTLLGCKSEKPSIVTTEKVIIKETITPPTKTDHLIENLHYLVKDDSIKHSITINENDFNIHFNDSIHLSLPIDSIHELSTQNLYNHLLDQIDLEYEYLPFPILPTIDSLLPLKGIKIALDPGHSAGTLESAKIEGKYVELLQKENPELKEDIKLIESELNFQTASILKTQLEKQGAIVLMTRNKVEEAAMGYTFDYWYNNLFKRHLDSLRTNDLIEKDRYNYFLKLKKKNTDYCKKVIFGKLFNPLDFQTRAKKINTFQPHLTIVIHYNVDVKNDPWTSPSKLNKTMSFIPGAFMDGELESKEDQFHFLRILFSDQITQSALLSASINNRFNKDCNIPSTTENDSIPYLLDYCINTKQKGVYSRNLALTRTLTGILCYAEPLYQDNITESQLLSQKDIKMKEFYTSKRVETIANAYYNGIIDFLTETRNR